MTRLNKREQEKAINALTINQVDFSAVLFGQADNSPKITVEVEVEPTQDIKSHIYDSLTPLQTKIWKVLGGAVDVFVIKRNGQHIAIFTAYDVSPSYFTEYDYSVKERSNKRHVAKIALNKVRSVIGLVIAKVFEPVIEAVEIVKSQKVEKAERLAKIKALVLAIAWLSSLIQLPQVKVNRFFNINQGDVNNGQRNQATCSMRGVFYFPSTHHRPNIPPPG